VAVLRYRTRRLVLAAASLALIVVAAAALVVAAALVPAPAAVLPVLVPVCIGAPIAGALEFAGAVAEVNAPRAELRRELDRLPETPHPHGY
jgi:hypothetical protein